MRIRAALVLTIALACAAPAAAAPAPATFAVGAAKESIAPIPGVPVYAGGFGFSPPITTQHDPMEVRAFSVANGRKVVAMAVVDAQAYFAAYQEGPDYGITSVREEAARQIAERTGIPTTKADIVVQATHSHAGVTLEGIWGPVPLPYLKLVHDQTVKAIVDAATGARPAHLQAGTFDAPWLNNVDINQTDSYPGWTQDGQVSVLRAVAPGGAPIASFVSVPAHGDIVEGSGEKTLSADYFGFVRAALDERLGGVNVVGPATLGRNETPIQVGGIEPSKWFAGVVTSIAGRIMAGGHWLTKDTLASAETFTRVPGTNPALFALNAAWQLPDPVKQQEADASGIYPIDRSLEPPYLTGTTIGTDLTALRIGDAVFLSMPGEPFPEVRNQIARAVTGADMVVALSKGQDDWGYFYPAWAAPFADAFFAANGSDHHLYNIAPQAGDQVIQTQTQNIGALGFGVETVNVSPPLAGNRYEQATRPGLQAMASPTWGDAGPGGTLSVAFTAVWSNALVGDAARDGAVHVDFGDGTAADVQPDKRQRFVHDYTPGRHTVTLSGKDADGKVATWSLVVEVFPPLRAAITDEGGELAADTVGGDGAPLAYRWDLGDGTVAYGRRVADPGGPAILTVTDGTTSTATASVSGTSSRPGGR
ncbi:MAG: primase [Solirubrobacterales bacterium]|nr:primase [Solirubrobacterales bacterium]